ncbi:MAG: ABC transporter permease subunit [Anaerolineales bacterium]
MKNRRVRRSAAATVALILTIIPVGLFLAVVINVVWQSLPAFTQVGLKVLFSTEFSNTFSGIFTPGQYGLLPAMWGTLLVACVAQILAFPVALAMAIFASEFSIGRLGGVMEALLALFSGIPPIIYALLSVFVLSVFIQPEIAGQGLMPAFIKTLPGLPPWSPGMLPNDLSTLLGGIMLALLIVPFMAPIMLDAIRNVPGGLKEASLALGANRWFTLRHVTLPAALSGLVAAFSLGILKTIGDVVISAWTIGYIKNGLASPLFNIFQPNAPLTSTAAGILSGLLPGHITTNVLDVSVAYFTALLLLVVAFVLLGAVDMLQRALQRSFKA